MAEAENQNHKPEAPSLEPVLVEIRKDQYEPDTVGNELIPEDMAGRLRPESLLATPINKLTTMTRGSADVVSNVLTKKQMQVLETKGLSDLTLKQLLSLPLHQIRQVRSGSEIEERIARFLEQSLSVGPDGILVASTFWGPLKPISPEADIARHQALTAAVDAIPIKRRKEVLQERFGLSSGKVKNHKDVSDALDWKANKQRVQAVESRAKRDIRKISPKLLDFLPYYDDSLAIKAWGPNVTCHFDLPENIKGKLDLTFADLGLGEQLNTDIAKDLITPNLRALKLREFLCRPNLILSPVHADAIISKLKSFGGGLPEG